MFECGNEPSIKSYRDSNAREKGQIRSDRNQTREKEKKTAAEHCSMGYPRSLEKGIARERIESGKHDAVSLGMRIYGKHRDHSTRKPVVTHDVIEFIGLQGVPHRTTVPASKPMALTVIVTA